MGEAAALRLALELLYMPSRVRALKASPLPDGVAVLLRIAAGEEAAAAEAAELSGRSPAVVRNAAAFFLEQILLFPEADSYRVLGATRNASGEELRRNMALLMRWLHPDVVHQQAERTIFAGRVTRAWENLKTPDRRSAYDASQGAIKKKSQRYSNGARKPQESSAKRRARLIIERQRPEAPPVWSLRRLLLGIFYRPR
jgi:hypothetical protein